MDTAPRGYRRTASLPEVQIALLEQSTKSCEKEALDFLIEFDNVALSFFSHWTLDHL